MSGSLIENSDMSSSRASQSGFTLIEVIITVAIIGIIAAVAVPSYSRYVTEARRTDAITFLAEVAGEQQRYFTENNQYAADMKELGYGNAATFESPEGHYVVSVSNPGGSGRFLLTATPVSGGKQASDAECLAFTINDTGARKNTGSLGDCW